jgi:hypothetical protein
MKDSADSIPWQAKVFWSTVILLLGLLLWWTSG